MKPERKPLLGLTILLAGALFFLGLCPAAAKTKSGANVSPVTIKPIRPPELVPAPNGDGEEKRPAFTATGVIDAIEGDTMTVSDTLYLLNAHTKFYSQKGRFIGRSSFKIGTFVGVIVNSSGKVEALYLLQ
ncbi:MAG: hypothetical protein AB1921_11480 [Thermodesulfobacteriota bacterium]